MSKYYEYNPHNGVTEIEDYSIDGKVTVYQQEDVQPVIEQCKIERDLGLADKGIKKNLWLYARIPTTVCYELIKKGLDPFDKNVSAKRLEQEIDQNYPYLKTTSKRAN